MFIVLQYHNIFFELGTLTLFPQGFVTQYTITDKMYPCLGELGLNMVVYGRL